MVVTVYHFNYKLCLPQAGSVSSVESVRLLGSVVSLGYVGSVVSLGYVGSVDTVGTGESNMQGYNALSRALLSMQIYSFT